MLSRFICVRLCVTLWTIAHQAPLSMGFSRQEYWRRLPCPLPVPASLLSTNHDSNSLLSSLPGSSTVPQPHTFQLQFLHFSISVKGPVLHPFIHAKGSSETWPLLSLPRSLTFHFLKIHWAPSLLSKPSCPCSRGQHHSLDFKLNSFGFSIMI